MHLFVTGGTGFIGSHFIRAALSAGHQVKALRRSISALPSIPLSIMPTWVEGDLFSISSDWFKDIDAVIHLASAGVSPQVASWSELISVNVSGSLRLLEQSAQMGVRRFVIAGTSHEYGETANHYEFIPPDAPLQPLSPYGASKAAAFQVFRAFAKQHGLSLFYGRIFSAYGDGQFSGNFWPSLKSAALSGDNFSMTSGTQIADFIPVSKVAEYLLAACYRSDIDPGSPLVTNIGSGIPRTLLQFAETEWKRFGASGSLLPGSMASRPNSIARYVPDLIGL